MVFSVSIPTTIQGVSQLLPPLIIDENTAREIIERVDRALDDAKKFLNL